MGASQRLHGALTNLAQCLMTESGTSMAAAIAGRVYLFNDSTASILVINVSNLHGDYDWAAWKDGKRQLQCAACMAHLSDSTALREQC